MNKLAIRPVEQAEIETLNPAPQGPAWSWLPDEAPLAMPVQSLSAPEAVAEAVPATSPRTVGLRRLMLLAGTLVWMVTMLLPLLGNLQGFYIPLLDMIYVLDDTSWHMAAIASLAANVLLFTLMPAVASAVGCIVTSGRWDMYAAFLAPVVVLSAASMFSSGDERVQALGWLASVFGVGLMVLHHVVSRSTLQGIRLQWRSDHLLRDLARQHQIIVHGGSLLEAEGEKGAAAGSAISGLETALDKEKTISAEALAKVELLNQQISAMRRQLQQLNAILSESEARNTASQAQIADLGKRLNSALAQKVQELTRYRSEFFGRLRQILSQRSDILVVGDRFVFQSEVLFPKGQAELNAAGQEEMLKLAEALKQLEREIPEDIGWVLRVDGHTDNDPIQSPQFRSNWELSTARAIAVVKFLISAGVAPQHLVAAGFGDLVSEVDRAVLTDTFADWLAASFRSSVLHGDDGWLENVGVPDGGPRSIVQVYDVGVPVDTLPAASSVRTANVCEPSARPDCVTGLVHAAYAAPSRLHSRRNSRYCASARE